MEHDADVIIIGAGHNSLTAALYLQKAGLSVLIIEQAKIAGGAAKTAEILEPGFKHDLFASNIGLFMGSRIYNDFKEEFHQNGFDIVVGDQPFSSVFPDGKCVRVYTDGEKTLREFERHSHHDANAWSEMISYFQKVAPHLFPILQLPMPSLKPFVHLWKMYRQCGSQELLELIRVLLMSPRQFLDERFETDEVKALLSPWAFHLGLSPDCAGGATFSFLESAVDHLNGLALSKGGVGNMINAMVRAIETRGGQFVLGQAVSEIVVKKGTACGVKTADGVTYNAKKAVMANVTPKQFIKLVSEKELPENFVVKSKNYRFGPGTLMIHFTLEHALEWEAAEDLADSAYVHIAPYMSDIAATYSQVVEGYLPASPLLVVAQQSRLDSARAPEGKHVLWVQVRAFPHRPRGDALGEIKIGNWNEMKEPILNRIIDKIGQFAPNIREIVRKAVVWTPQDLEDENPNIVGGDMVGGSHHLDQNFFFRPFSGWSRYKTPVKQLYLTGASTWPGGGLNATSGHLAAMQLLREN
ncbi:MAG: NAD(P)/FAD-dependent oxidoreductase [Deltaproteobacteria bacterium]|nr:MAG: NAD(P)/FAD-dependent oxidoreductase [Deltaproteobacteria bacterium]